MRNGLSIKIKLVPTLWYIFLGLLVLDSLIQYRGVDWTSTKYVTIMHMQGKTIISLVLAKLAVLIALFVAIMPNGRLRKTIMTQCALLLLFVGILWTILSLNRGITLLYLNSNPTLLVQIAIVMVLVQRDDIGAILKKTCPYLACGYTLMAFIQANLFRLRFSVMRMENGPVIQYFAYALFLVAAWNAISKQTKREKIIIYICAFMLAITSIIITSRGWMLQAFILIVLCYLSTSTRKLGEKIRRIIGTAAILLVVYYVLQSRYADSFSFILGRIREDTRSTQFDAFFSQVPLQNLILGRGLNATYYFRGENYAFFDNQIIFWLFRYGILSVVGYWTPCIYAVFKNRKSRNNPELVKHIAVVIMWILAMNGLSIYYGLFLDIGNIICLFITSEILKEKGEIYS